ncbi:uncharacterized protein LOC134261723 [Saccostrea cucullata]|uniref:uncharacterized protein LOC134261723 n=1 Tax=Saccostrea cuccullata TaxID=36930 RepID=UPI002ED1645F
MTARTTAEALFHNFITYYGILSRIHSDQGANFESKIIKELCNITGMKKSRTTTYHAMGKGMTERFNRTLLDMLGTLEPHQKSNWKSHVAPLVHAYNCTRHESTNQSPYYLMFGREPRLPVDLAFGINNQQQKTLSKYIEDLRQKMKKAYEIATSSATAARFKQKEVYDMKTRGNNIKEGDRVLVKIVSFDGKHKIADRWEEDIYIESEPVQETTSDSESEEESDNEVPVPSFSQDIPHDANDEGESQVGIEVEDAQQAEDSDEVETEQQQLTTDQLGEVSQGDNSQVCIEDAAEIAPEETLVEDDEEEQQVRRSTRQKTQPSWMRSGEFVQSVQRGKSTEDPWNAKEKIQYLQSILITCSCRGFENKIIDTMIYLMKQ